MRNHMRYMNRGFFCVALLATLTACGGGGNFGGSSSGGTSSSSTGSGNSATRIGSGSGSAFKDGVLDVGTSSLSAGGSTSLTVTLVNGSGTLITTSSQITFNSPCISAGTATISSGGTTSTTVTAGSGTAIATYTAKGCEGADQVTATTTVGSATISATGTVTVAAAALGSIEFVSASPSTISIKDMGGTGLQQTSTLIFAVKDSVGGAVPGAAVTLKLVSFTGGVALSQATATSDANGNVSTIVTAGTHAGPVVVQASIVVSGKTITTNSSGLSIQGGIPSQTFFSLSLDTLNPEGFDIDGNKVNLTVRLADRFGNNVPDGTAVSFTESNSGFGAGGSIQASCLTTGGGCPVVWTSQNPRPSTVTNQQHVGFAYVLAFATGEEGFNDENGDGVFDDYRTCASCTLQAEPFDDIGEIYAPSAEFAPCTLSGTNPCAQYLNGEDYNDFNSDGLRNGPDGKWEGVNCKETLSGLCGSSTTTGVGTYACIVMSGSTAQFTNGFVNGTATNFSNGTTTTTGGGVLLAPGASTVAVAIADENGNVLPKDTTITLDTSGLTGATATLSPASGGSFKVDNTSCAGSVVGWPGRFVITINVATPPVSGSLELIVTTPSGTQSALVVTP